MAQCDECGCFNDDHIDNMSGIDQLTEDFLTEDHKLYANDKYYYWHGDIQEDYQMPPGYDCLCEECFGDFQKSGKVFWIDSPKWDKKKHGWFIPYKEEANV